jgi:hypothetical protein
MLSPEEEQKQQETEWYKKYETKTSFVMRLEGEPLYNFTLESVIVHHAEAVSSVTWDVSADHQQGQPLRLKDLVLLSSSFDFSVCLW